MPPCSLAPKGTRSARRRCLAATCLALAWLLSPAAVLDVSAEASAHRSAYAERHRAIAPDERARAAELALAAARERGAGSAPADERAIEGDGLEVLRVERHREPKGMTAASYRRRVDVLIYDYRIDHLCRVVVDLSAGAVDDVTVAPGIQVALSEREISRATRLLLLDPEARARLDARYERITGRRLRGAGDIQISGYVFRADAMPDAATESIAICGRHRCAQLLLRTNDDVSLELPIIDLSMGRVLETLDFGPVETRRSTGSGPVHSHGEEHDHAH